LEIEIQQLEDHYPFDLLLLADESLEAVNAYINKCSVYGVSFNKTLIGVMAVMPIDSNSIELKNIAIAEKHQNKGFGKQTINWLEHFYKEMGVKQFFVGTGDASHSQLIFYQKLGFEVHSIKKDFFRNNYPKPIFENGIRLRHMIMLNKQI
jgi:N-acetylglutamate synthase-like GNAT family acetyltransferase